MIGLTLKLTLLLTFGHLLFIIIWAHINIWILEKSQITRFTKILFVLQTSFFGLILFASIFYGNINYDSVSYLQVKENRVAMRENAGNNKEPNINVNKPENSHLYSIFEILNENYPISSVCFLMICAIAGTKFIVHFILHALIFRLSKNRGKSKLICCVGFGRFVLCSSFYYVRIIDSLSMQLRLFLIYIMVSSVWVYLVSYKVHRSISVVYCCLFVVMLNTLHSYQMSSQQQDLSLFNVASWAMLLYDCAAEQMVCVLYGVGEEGLWRLPVFSGKGPGLAIQVHSKHDLPQ
ncbi:uncharacterized protein ASCRUDRAFT_103262 [Ascoidea rubescens DSM 1968]|uniref:Uncharacterized protein n=1 Tax=Ascoidea rubescens DSM 1968 TaxID=1344418 RepID=A0A1D2VRF7_9ASCO|nr:hypothetical protein ASCRUDRAFT_103262 [Ascoidea rubescens DSM 1968]ODV64191.1 hypothetical protein ASCRUDRAFT_103262 [Ascoidea rubescens DSM 1968]